MTLRFTRGLILCLCLLLASGAFALADTTLEGEAITVEVEYTGNWFILEEFGFALMLPNTWGIVEGKDEVYFMAVEAAGTQVMWIELYDSAGNTMDTVLADLTSLAGFDQVTGVYYNGVPFVRYIAPKGNLLGFATLTEDGATLLFFKFSPLADEGMASLAMQILSTLSPISPTE